MTREAENALWTIMKRGGADATKARNKLVEANLNLAKKFANQYQKPHIPFEDLLHVGVMGLMHAAERFDPARGVKFGTYAFHWVRKFVQDAVIRNTAFTNPFIAGVKVTHPNGSVHTARGSMVGFDDLPVMEGHTVDDTLEDAAARSPEDDAWSKQAATLVRAAVRFIHKDRIDEAIIHERILASEPKTLHDVGAMFGLTREAIRLREVRILARLRSYMVGVSTPHQYVV